jgi:electron transfer flavoprotein alpha subunit
MAVLLIAESNAGALNVDATAKAMSAAATLGAVTILCASSAGEAVAEQAAKLTGAANILCCTDDAFDHDLAEPLADLIVSLAPDFTHIVAPSTAASKNTLPRVAGLLDAMVISDVTDIVDTETFVRPIYAGNALQTVQSKDTWKLMTIRTASFDAVGQAGAAEIEIVRPPANSDLSSWVEDRLAASDRPELTSAGVVVSGGRGVGSEDDFKLIEALADKLNAAIGASRAAVDSGYAPNDWQVGQTGKVVAPDLYVAVGISGAIQHLAGMKDSKIIVAINKDEEAPIFQVADFGLVADLFDAVPALTAQF